MRRRSAALIPLFAACLAMPLSGIATPDDDAVQLEEMEVIGSGSDLPCLGCGAAAQRAGDPIWSFLGFVLLPAEPAIPDDATRLATEIRYQDFGPDLNQR